VLNNVHKRTKPKKSSLKKIEKDFGALQVCYFYIFCDQHSYLQVIAFFLLFPYGFACDIKFPADGMTCTFACSKSLTAILKTTARRLQLPFKFCEPFK
jgi:hypothetical protein